MAPQNGFTAQQKQELAEIVQTIVNTTVEKIVNDRVSAIVDRKIDKSLGSLIDDVLFPFMESTEDRFIRIEKKLEKLDHLERIGNAHTAELYNMKVKLDAFIDRSAQHDE